MKLGHLFSLCLASAAATFASQAAFAQSHPEFVPLRQVNAAVYMPDSGPKPHVLVMVSHRTGNNLNTGACKEFAAQGFACMGWNTRFVNNERDVHWEDIAFDVKTAMDYAVKMPGITKIVMLAHSGGSPLFSYYEAVAEAGPSWCQGANKLVQCAGGAAMTGWHPADGIIFPDAHPGTGALAVRAINPSVSRNADGTLKVDPALDPFSEKNGYNPKGASHYSEDFQKRYFAAQSAKMNALIADVQAKMALMKEGKYRYPDDDIMIIPAGGNPGAGAGGDAVLGNMDPSIPGLMWTSKPEKLLKNDGTIVTQIVHSVSAPEPDMAKANRMFGEGTKVYTFKSFLSSYSVKSTNSLDGIDWCSTNNAVICNVGAIKIPTLIAAMGGYHFVRDQEIMFEKSAAADKDYVVIEGAVHGYTECKACETTPGQYANSQKNLYAYMTKWIKARF